METEITVSSIRSVVFAVVRFLSVRLSVTFVEPYRTKHDQVRILWFLTFCHFSIQFSIADVSVVTVRRKFDFKRLNLIVYL